MKGYVDALKKHKIQVDESLIIPYDLTLGKVKIYVRHLMALIEPSLTTVAQPQRLMGSTAMQLLLDLMDKEVSQWKAVTKILDSKLVVRNSSMVQESEPN